MKKNDVFTFTASNGAEVMAVVINDVARFLDYKGNNTIVYLCYAQNRLFTYEQEFWNGKLVDAGYRQEIADYAILPDYDRMLEDHSHQLDMANDYADKTL